MAHSLGLGVVAEGVETTEQEDFLLEHACGELQGFLFGRAIPEEQFTRALERERDGLSSPFAETVSVQETTLTT